MVEREKIRWKWETNPLFKEVLDFILTTVKLFVSNFIETSNLGNLSRPNPGPREKIKLFFHTSLWCLKKVLWRPLRPSKNLLRYHKEVWKQKFNLIFISVLLSEMYGTGRVKTAKEVPDHKIMAHQLTSYFTCLSKSTLILVDCLRGEK